MIFLGLDGVHREGHPVGNGPKASSVWVMLEDRSFVVVSTRGDPTQIEWETPAYVKPVPPQTEQWAREIVDRHKALALEFTSMGLRAEPVGEEYAVAIAVLKQADLARESREPFLAAHGGNQAVGDAKFKQLSGFVKPPKEK